MLRPYLPRLRWLALLLPAFALFSSVQTGCTGGSTGGEDYASEDFAGTGYGYGYR